MKEKRKKIKQENVEKTKINVNKIKNKLKNIVATLVILNSTFYIIIIYDMFLFKENSYYAKEIEEFTDSLEVVSAVDMLEEFDDISQTEKIDLEKIINNNTQNIKEEIYTITSTLEYTTEYMENSSLAIGQLQVVQEGREGISEVTYKRTYINDELASEEEVQSTIVKANVKKIVEIGTNKYVTTYLSEIGDYVYATSDRLIVRISPSEDAEKTATLSTNTKMEIEEILDEWYKISSGTVHGYVKIESTTNINSEEITEEISNLGTGGTIISPSFNMNLNLKSGLSLEQFEQILTDSKDVNGIFEENAKYFYYAEQQYNINGLFLAAVGIHESGWGTSNICINKNNMFGYGAYDSSPYSSSFDFSDYSEGIDLIARVFVKYYLNPEGTTIYSGETATGQYYNGNTISSVNIKYATDTNWANLVYSYITYLYNKL